MIVTFLTLDFLLISCSTGCLGGTLDQNWGGPLVQTRSNASYTTPASSTELCWVCSTQHALTFSGVTGTDPTFGGHLFAAATPTPVTRMPPSQHASRDRLHYKSCQQETTRQLPVAHPGPVQYKGKDKCVLWWHLEGSQPPPV